MKNAIGIAVYISVLACCFAASAWGQTPKEQPPPTILRGGQTHDGEPHRLHLVPPKSDDSHQNASPIDRSPSFLADPKTYVILYEDASLRVLTVNWKAGKIDQPHIHPLPSVVIFVDNCHLILHDENGTHEINGMAGMTMTVAIEKMPHQEENPTNQDCHAIIVERK